MEVRKCSSVPTSKMNQQVVPVVDETPLCFFRRHQHWWDRCWRNRGSAAACSIGIWHLVCQQERIPAQWVFFVSLNVINLTGKHRNWLSWSHYKKCVNKLIKLKSKRGVEQCYCYQLDVCCFESQWSCWQDFHFVPLQRRLKGKRIFFSWAGTGFPQIIQRLDWYNLTILYNT